MRRAAILPVGVLALAFGACDAGMERDQDVAAPPPEAMRDEPGAPAGEPREEAREEARDDTSEAAADARDLVQQSSGVLDQMKRDPELAGLLQQARGVFVVPNYGRGAALVGASGGEGLLLARSDGGWSGPAFYDIGRISVGAQLGASGGSIAMLLMNEEALDRFGSQDDFSLDADAGLTLLDYSARAQADVGEADVILWSDTEGAFAGAALGVSDIAWDDAQNRGYYDASATPEAVMSGRVRNQEAESLRQKLSS